ncbi:hypothetical protein HXX76_013788 [Chlamydomonas incerta]|uniref:Uncharacterized protein n=1 Tax=Chlamydomonas incerta TaxID=51695 RepID=A0A835SNE8_CHLIN|nr:hypothetical protein HXX76_013788 [Chlamydomonas incerta]|eukprot:KAG2425374.1 hypothetical protein HXX76_013788 [Chlamydomonas incerta]
MSSQLVDALGGAETQAVLLGQLSQLAVDAAQLLKAVVSVVAGAPTAGAARAPGGCADGAEGASEDGALTAACSTAVAAAARLALGPGGAACSHHLSEQPDADLRWLTAQQRVVEAVRGLASWGRSDGAGACTLPPLMPLWLSLRGPSGLRSRSDAVRRAAVRLLVDLLLLQHQLAQHRAPADRTSATAPADVGMWAVVQELAGNVAPWDAHADVRAAALHGADALLAAACVDGTGGARPRSIGGAVGERVAAKEWRRVVEGVLTAAAKAAPEPRSASATATADSPASCPEVWQAALEFARHHCRQLGWRGAVRHLASQLVRAAACEDDPEGPLAAYGIADVARAVAGAAALEAALGGSIGLLPDGTAEGACGDGEGASAPANEDTAAASGAAGAAGTPAGATVGRREVAQRLLAVAAACITDAVGRYGPGCGRGAAAVGAAADAEGSQQRWYSMLLPGTCSGQDQMAALAPGPEPCTSGGEAEAAAEAEAAVEAVAVTRSMRSMCEAVARTLSAGDALSVLEALASKAESAPLAPRLPSSSSPAAAAAALVPSRASVLLVAAAVAAGASGRIRAAGGADLSVEALAAAVRLSRLMRRLGALLQDPDQHLFAEAGGAPVAPTGSNAALARQSELAVAAGLAALAALLQALPSPLVYSVAASSGAGDPEEGARGPADASAGGAAVAALDPQPWQSTTRRREESGAAGRNNAPFGSGHRKPQVFIEEVSEEPASPTPAAAPAPHHQALEAWREQQAPLVSDLLLLIATYAPCAPGGAAAGSSNAPDPGLPPPPTEVDTPWAAPAGPAAAAASLLFVLLSRSTRVLPSPTRALRATSPAGGMGAGGAAGGLGGGSLGLLPAEAVLQQELLLGCGAALMRDVIRPVVVQKHVQALEEGPIKPYSGPDTFTRALATRRLAWMLLRCRHPFSSEALRLALPLLLAASDDPSPGVAAYGVAALHAVAVECLAADLQWQRDLLLDAARRLVTGCSEQLWPLACPAAVALTHRIEGKDPRAPGYHALACTLLTEAERGAHVAARRLSFMPPAACLVTCMGLTACRYLSRLMPLLLEWLHAHDDATRAQALALLGAVLRATWPRVPAHAATLWRHLLLVQVWAEGEPGVVGAGEADAAGREEVRRRAEEVCALLLACAQKEVMGFAPGPGRLAPAVEKLHERLVAGRA